MDDTDDVGGSGNVVAGNRNTQMTQWLVGVKTMLYGPFFVVVVAGMELGGIAVGMRPGAASGRTRRQTRWTAPPATLSFGSSEHAMQLLMMMMMISYCCWCCFYIWVFEDDSKC